MRVVNTVSREQAPEQIVPLYEALTKKYGRMPNIFATMAKRPAALAAFLPFMQAVMEESTLEPRHRELAYLKTSMLNGCAY